MLEDLLFSVRELRKRPGLALTAAISLTLGIGATTAVFSVIYALLVNPYPYLGADRMIELNVLNEKGDNHWIGLTGPQLKIIQQASCVEAAAASWGTWNLTTTGEELPEDVPSVQISANAGVYFGVPALLGRTFIPSDAPDGQDPAAGDRAELSVLAAALRLRSDRGGAESSTGSQELHDCRSSSVAIHLGDADVYVPLKLTNDANVYLQPARRLKPGVTHEAANAELQPLFEQFAKETPSHYPKKFRTHVRGLNDRYMEHLGRSLYLLFGAVALLLLIGCANVSILLLARGTARQHELAIRSAIGASRWRIQRQLLTEALALSLAGAAGGVLLAYRAVPMLVRWLPEYSFPHEAVISD